MVVSRGKLTGAFKGLKSQQIGGDGHMPWRRARGALVAMVCSLMMLATGAHVLAQGTSCQPVSERTGEVGCWIMADVPLGTLSEAEVFWHLDTYPSRAAAEAAKGPRGTVIEALGKVWLFTIGEAGWRPSGGTRVEDLLNLRDRDKGHCGGCGWGVGHRWRGGRGGCGWTLPLRLLPAEGAPGDAPLPGNCAISEPLPLQSVVLLPIDGPCDGLTPPSGSVIDRLPRGVAPAA